jgi:hypothetical protein
VSLDLVLREKSRRKSNHGCRFEKGSLSTMSSRRGKDREDGEGDETILVCVRACCCACVSVDLLLGCRAVVVLCGEEGFNLVKVQLT